MFNLGAGEVVVLTLLGILFLGPAHLPDLAARFRAGESLPIRGRWSWSDWVVACTAATSAAIALHLTLGRR